MLDARFLQGLHSTVERGILDPRVASGYASDAVIELFLPGGARVARGAQAVAAELARTLPSPAEVVDWTPGEGVLMLEAVTEGTPARRVRQYHRFRVADGLIERHWVYACAPDFGGENYSGALVNRVERDDGAVFVKRISPGGDWMMRATNDAGREANLWLDGPLRSLPAGIECATVAAERDGNDWVLTMRDLSASLLPDEPSPEQWTRMIDGHSVTARGLRRGASRGTHEPSGAGTDVLQRRCRT